MSLLNFCWRYNEFAMQYMISSFPLLYSVTARVLAWFINVYYIAYIYIWASFCICFFIWPNSVTKSSLFAKHPYINCINITKFVINVENRKKGRKCTPRKSNVNEYCIHSKTFLRRICELWLWWSLGGEELFFDEFVYLWSVEVYICTDVRNSCYLQKCASFT